MSLWGVRVVMGSSLESLGTSFWTLSGPFLKPSGVILGALGGHFGSLGGSLGDFLDVFGARQKAIYPQDRSARHTFGILSSQNGPRWLPEWSQNGPKIDQKSDQQKGCRNLSETGGVGGDKDLPRTSKTIPNHCKT